MASRGGAGRPSAPTVLVVDDNPDMREYIARLLEPYWRVATAPDGVEALAEARRARPDLVLTDVMMPHLDGFGLLEALRADPLTATVPVVFLSARAGEDAAVEGLDAGADDYLVKPFSALELLARVRSNLELSGLRNEETAWRRALVESLREGVAVLDAPRLGGGGQPRLRRDPRVRGRGRPLPATVPLAPRRPAPPGGPGARRGGAGRGAPDRAPSRGRCRPATGTGTPWWSRWRWTR